jgi:hypothetical protein
MPIDHNSYLPNGIGEAPCDESTGRTFQSCHELLAVTRSSVIGLRRSTSATILAVDRNIDLWNAKWSFDLERQSSCRAKPGQSVSTDRRSNSP